MIPRRQKIEAALLRLAPRIPPHERDAVIDHAVDSKGLRTASPETAAWLSLVSYVRHVFTDYDALLADDTDPDSARFSSPARSTTCSRRGDAAGQFRDMIPKDYCRVALNHA